MADGNCTYYRNLFPNDGFRYCGPQSTEKKLKGYNFVPCNCDNHENCSVFSMQRSVERRKLTIEKRKLEKELEGVN